MSIIQGANKRIVKYETPEAVEPEKKPARLFKAKQKQEEVKEVKKHGRSDTSGDAESKPRKTKQRK